MVTITIEKKTQILWVWISTEIGEMEIEDKEWSQRYSIYSTENKQKQRRKKEPKSERKNSGVNKLNTCERAP